MSESAEAVKRWRSGQAAAARRQRELLAIEGPEPEKSVAEALAALNALDAMRRWPAPRDEVSEHALELVRRRWARIQRRATASARSR
jgi:hypothetical protein